MAKRIDHRHIAGDQPSISVEAFVRLHVAGRDPRPLGAEMPDGLAVPRQLIAGIIDDAQRRTEAGAAGHHASIELFRVTEALGTRPQARHRASESLGHAPSLDVVDMIVTLEFLDHRTWRCRA